MNRQTSYALPLQSTGQVNSKLIVTYQPFIKKIIHNFVCNSYIAASETMDYVQLVNEKLLLKLQSDTFKNYEIKTSLKGFLAVAVKNIVKNEIRAQKLRSTQSLDSIPLQLHHKKSTGIFTKLEWEQQTKRLQRILRLFHQKDRSKMEFCLMVIYHIPLKAEKLQSLYPNATQKEIHQLLELFEQDGRMDSKATTWKKLNEGLHILEQKKSQVDALRKWYAKRYKVVVHNLFKKYPQLEKTNVDAYFEHLLYAYHGA